MASNAKHPHRRPARVAERKPLDRVLLNLHAAVWLTAHLTRFAFHEMRRTRRA